MGRADVLVIGAGINGLLTALELRRAGAAVRVLDRGPAGRGASWAGGGILSPLHPWRYPEAVTALARWSQARWPALAAELREASGVDPEWWRCGLLVLGLDGDERAAARGWCGRQGLAALDADAVAVPERARCLAEEVLEPEALWLPDIAQVRNPRLVRALRGAALAAGVELAEGRAAEALEVRGGRVRGVRTAAGREEAGAVLVTAGAWSAGLFPPGLRAPRVEPVRGQMLAWPPGAAALETIVLRGGHYLIPRRDGRILCGSTVERAGLDAATTEAGRAELARAAAALCPALGRAAPDAHWAGLRPAAPGGVPYIGPHPDAEGLFLNVGQYRNGVVLAPASARLAADFLLGRAPTLDPTPYAFDAPRPAEVDSV